MRENIAIVVPSYNERNNIHQLIEQVEKKIPNCIIYIVDDNSPDNTRELVKKIMKPYKNLRLIEREKKSGRGGAILEGFSQALKIPSVRYFIEMDADLSHSPSEIEKLIKSSKEGIVVVGSRYVNGSKILNWPLYRRILSRLANFYIRIVLGIKINDFTNGFRCYTRRATEILCKSKINYKGFIALSEFAYILHLKNFNFIEVPITFKDRESGNSNATVMEVFKSLYAVTKIREKYAK